MKKAVRPLVSVIILSILTSFNTPRSKSDWLDGQWLGVKYQVDMKRGWKTELTVDVKAAVFTIQYPDLECKGHLELVKLTRNKAIFKEKIDGGPCLDDGYIIIGKVSDQYISFTCLRDNNERLASYCTLTRQSKDK